MAIKMILAALKQESSLLPRQPRSPEQSIFTAAKAKNQGAAG